MWQPSPYPDLGLDYAVWTDYYASGQLGAVINDRGGVNLAGHQRSTIADISWASQAISPSTKALPLSLAKCRRRLSTSTS